MAGNETLKWVWAQVKMLAIAAFLAFFCIRGFVFEPFRIPSRSMEPTLLVGDFLFVSKFAYGNRIPGTNHFLWQREPQRGDVVVFKKTGSGLPGSFFGLGPTLFIKRLVGMPGDTISYRGQRLYINGEEVRVEGDERMFDTFRMQQGYETPLQGSVRTEVLGNIQHDVMQLPDSPDIRVAEATVPEGHYVMMGDNRDNSRDSRLWSWPSWTFVPKEDLMGRAEFIFWSMGDGMKPRFDRIGNGLRAEAAPVTDGESEEAVE